MSSESPRAAVLHVEGGRIALQGTPEALTPAQARQLAAELLEAAEKAAQPPCPTPAEVAGNLHPPQVEQTGGVGFSIGARRYMRRQGIYPAQIAAVIKAPSETWPDPQPRKNRPTVAVAEGQPWGAVYYPNPGEDAYVIAVRRRHDLYAARRNAGAGKTRPSSGGPKQPAITSLDDLIRRAEAAGLVYRQGDGHGRLHRPGHPETVTVPLTPSDARAWKNTTAEIRRTLGVRV